MKTVLLACIAAATLAGAPAVYAATSDAPQFRVCVSGSHITCVPYTISIQNLSAGQIMTLPAKAEPAMADHFELRLLDKDHFVLWVFLRPQPFGEGLAH